MLLVVAIKKELNQPITNQQSNPFEPWTVDHRPSTKNIIFGIHSSKILGMENTWYAIVNPAAGGSTGDKKWKKIEADLKELGIAFQPHLTTAVLHASHIVKEAVEKGYRKLLIVGGDGTLNEVVNGLFAQNVVPTHEVTIALISIGTGNDWIKTMGIPADTKQAARLLKNGTKTRIIDAGLAYYHMHGHKHSRHFINVAGMAFDAEVTRHANANKSSLGPMQYWLSLAKTLFTFSPVPVKVEVDGKVYEDLTFCLNVGNCQFAGGGMMIVPGALPDDGLFTITHIKNASRWTVIKNVAALGDGTFIKLEEVDQYTGKTVKVTSPVPVWLEVEGEVLGEAPFEFQILPGAVKVLVG